MFATLVIFFIELVGVLSVVLVFGVPDRARSNRMIKPVLSASVLLGYIGGVTLVWRLLPPATWQISFWQTLAASVDTETYGHPTEHYAENLVVAMLVASAGGALISGILAAAASRLWTHSAGSRANRQPA
jgi:hypothetical protein